MFRVRNSSAQAGKISLRVGLLLMFTLLVLIGLGGSINSVHAQAATPAETVLEVSAPAKVDVGQQIEIKLTVKHAHNLAGYEMHMLFDNSAAHFNGVHERQNGFKKFGRDILPLVLSDSDNGAAFGFASCPTNNCVTRGGNKQKRGAKGNVYIGSVILEPLKAGTLQIKLDAAKFVKPNGTPLAVRLATDTITIQVRSAGPLLAAPGSSWQLRATAGKPVASMDLTHHKRVDYADAAEVAFGWTTVRQNNAPCSNLPDASLDVNQDGCIDVSDVQMVTTASGLAAATPQVATAPMNFVVTVATDASDPNPGDGVCAAWSGGCSLRAAITEANAHPGPDTITFNIPGGGVKTITLSTTEPTLSDTTGGTTIDGYTQPGSSPNTDPFASNAAIMIQLKGNGASAFDAIHISSGGNVIRGIALYNMKASFYVGGSAASNNLWAGNIIGTDVTGTFVAPSTVTGATGIYLDVGANNNHIGTSALADRNVISGNARMGVATYSQGTDSNFVQNNIIGLSPLGDRRVRNFKHGVDINNASSFNMIGGTGPKEGNLISGDGDPSEADPSGGVEISHDTSTIQNKVLGNCFGTDITCTTMTSFSYLQHYGIRFEDGVNNNEAAYNVIGNAKLVGVNFDAYYADNNFVHDNFIGVTRNGNPVPNGIYGVRVKYHAQHNKIGPNNIIANNPTGVLIEYNDELYNTITQNSIYNNSFLGIDLGPHEGVSYNTNGDDVDSGANNGLDYPVITGATPLQASGKACTDTSVPKPCTVEVFIAQSTASNDGGGLYGQGKTYLGSGTTAADGSFTVALSGVNNGDLLTATATDAQGDTSEFSLNVTVSGTAPTSTPTTAPTDVPTTAPTTVPTDTPTAGPTMTPTPTTVGPTNTPTTAPTNTPTTAPTNTPTTAPTTAPTNTPTPSGPITYVSDSFTRNNANGWAVADKGGSYSLSGGTTAHYSVDGSEGIMNANAANSTHSASLLSVSAQDVDARVRITTDQVAAGGAQIGYLVLRRINSNTDYLVRIRYTPSNGVRVEAMSEVGGTQTEILGEKVLNGVTQTANQFVWLRTQVTGTNPTTIKIKAWVDGQPEPSTWLYTATDSTAALQATGSFGLRAYLATSATNAPVLFKFDDLLITSP